MNSVITACVVPHVHWDRVWRVRLDEKRLRRLKLKEAGRLLECPCGSREVVSVELAAARRARR